MQGLQALKRESILAPVQEQLDMEPCRSIKAIVRVLGGGYETQQFGETLHCFQDRFHINGFHSVSSTHRVL